MPNEKQRFWVVFFFLPTQAWDTAGNVLRCHSCLPGSAQHQRSSQPVPGKGSCRWQSSRACSLLLPVPCQPTLGKLLLLLLWALFSLEEELGRAFPTLPSDLIRNAAAVLCCCQCSGESWPSFALALKAVLAGEILYFHAGWCCEVPIPVTGVHSPFFFYMWKMAHPSSLSLISKEFLINSLGIWQKSKHSSLGEKRPFDPIEWQEMEHWLSLGTITCIPHIRSTWARTAALQLALLLNGNFVCIYITNFIF